MEKLLKVEIHQLIDNCDDDALLNEAKTILESKNNMDWWDEISAQQQAEISAILNEPDEKDIISHDSYVEATAKWRTK